MGRQRSSSVGQQRKNLGQLLRSNAVQRITKRRDVQSRTGSSLLQAFTGGNTSRAKLWQAARTVENDSYSDQWCWVCKGHSTQALRASRRCISELSQARARPSSGVQQYPKTCAKPGRLLRTSRTCRTCWHLQIEGALNDWKQMLRPGMHSAETCKSKTAGTRELEPPISFLDT